MPQWKDLKKIWLAFSGIKVKEMYAEYPEFIRALTAEEEKFLTQNNKLRKLIDITQALIHFFKLKTGEEIWW